jgi:hypothetical protein
MQTKTAQDNWARHTSEYFRAIAPHATPLLEVCRDLFSAVGDTRQKLLTQKVEDTSITPASF